MKINEMIETAEKRAANAFLRVDKNALVCQERVLKAFQAHRISARHFAPTEGYGYDDVGRDALDEVFADALTAESALVRPQIANGTHAIFLALSGVLEPNDTVLSLTGTPYDTLESAVGLNGDIPNALSRFSIRFHAIPLCNDRIDFEKAGEELKKDATIRMVYLQRSRGYAWRTAMTVKQIGEAIAFVRSIRSDIIVFVDNCYGEFTEEIEPTAVGADLIAGSLIKNCGGGIAPTGGYIAGRKDLIEAVSYRQTVPGCGKEIGSYAASYRPFYQGLFMAPHVVAQCLKSAILFSALFESLGLKTLPGVDDARSDIIQSVMFDTKEEMIAFMQAVQAAAPIDSFVVPEPWDMPGYTDPVIMAAGTFVQGATTELSADGPIRAPYTAYMQGALTYEHAVLAAKSVLNALIAAH
ncbi:MAG: methionine gamma-lyase family protein [Clostridia bacterium]|nr:methionine gamma-lyase family protein [Clostridia bacterium]